MNKKERKDLEYVGIILAVFLVAYFVFGGNAPKSLVYYNGLSQAPNYALTSGLVTTQPISSSNSNLFSLSGAQPSNISYVGTQLTASMTIPISSANITAQTSSTAVNTQCDDFVYDNTTSTIVSQGSVTSPSTSPYTASISYTPSAIGTYVYGAICQTSKTSYNIATNSWSAWSAPVVAGQSQLFAVKIVQTATPPPPPSFSLSALINEIITAITNFLQSIGL
jgi:hypothetical protein